MRVVAIDAPAAPRRLGFMVDHQFTIPDDFDRMDADEIAELFEGGPVFPEAEPRGNG